jgi:hypothetical protein
MVDWKQEYFERLKDEIRLNKNTVQGNIRVDIHVYDLLEKSGLCKSGFYSDVFMMNAMMSELIGRKVVLFIK